MAKLGSKFSSGNNEVLTRKVLFILISRSKVEVEVEKQKSDSIQERKKV